MQTPKGFRDLLPEDAEILEWIIDKIRTIYRSYDYLPIDTPVLEKIETLTKKANDEIKGQMFIIDGNALRYEFTSSLARFVSSYDLKMPFKRYQIGKVWRKEEPQKGRYREFYQADIDIIGSSSIRAEEELIDIANKVLKEFNFSQGKVYINDRSLINEVLSLAGIEDKEFVMRTIDKIDKIGKEKVLAIINEKENGDKLFEQLDRLKEDLGSFSNSSSLIYLLDNTKAYFDPYLVRGLAYYTGVVMEAKASAEIGSIGGGGRYDNLLELYGKPRPAVGFSFGVSRLLYLFSGKKIPIKKRIFIVSFKDSYKQAKEIAEILRKNYRVAIDLSERSIRKQLDYAKDYDAILFVGQKEISNNSYKLKTKEKELFISREELDSLVI